MKVHRFALWFLLLAGCQASAKGRIDSGGDVDAEARAARQDEDAFEGFREPEQAAAAPLAPATTGRPVLLGARHDLFLRDGAGAPSCRCLRVVASRPADERFYWESAVPEIDSSRQMVVAFTSRGQVCPDEPEGSQGAAYHGYEKRGPNVIVMVEASLPGRPQVTGAILPRPDPGGQLLIRPVPSRLPYGKPLDGDGDPCVVPTDAVTGAASPAGPDDPELASVDSQDFDSLGDDPNHPSDDADALAQRRKGLYFGVLLGPAYSLLDADDPAVDATASGVGVAVDILLGGSPSEGLAIGAIAGAIVTPEPDFEAAGQSFEMDGANLNIARFGAFLDYYFMRDANLHGLVELGYMSASFSGSRQLVLDDALGGFAVGAGLGYDFWISKRFSAGFMGRFGYAWLDSSQSEATAMLPALLGTLTFH